MQINLNELVGSKIKMTTATRKLTIKGQTGEYRIAIIPLDLCHYNDQNGRISTYISEYISNGNTLNKSSLEDYNNVLEKFIYNSNPEALKATKNNIKLFKQKVAGVVLNDGRIIDGNRRFTALRQLKREGKDVYFEAIILNPDEGLEERDIKRLELNLQHAEEKPVDYNPIDNLVDVYRDLIENKLFSELEYGENINKKPAEVELLMKKAELMVQFLNYINADKKYYIARDLALDGPLQEMVRILEGQLKGIDVRTILLEDHQDKSEQAEYLRIRNALFTAIFAKRKLNESESKGDMTRDIREIGKFIIKATNREEFLNQFEDTVEDVYEAFQNLDAVDVNSVKELGRDLADVRQKAQKIIEKHVEDTRLILAKAKPVDLLSKAFEDLKRIEVDQVKYMDPATEQEFLTVFEEVQKKLKEFGEALNV
ncbi:MULTISPECIES: ParB/RepB/Spo0J family partition protein [unclassified Bacillus cereus group]|uniref:ParB/RepB/Spo0J family partition protein n=1 Tax=unclassified Bacillus cereus group TaxID=2750818 RepID=UPI001F56932C|nr:MULTISPECIES: ParB/RepB/Spo0J family partition protein [unclassified Bacillus cereus group]